MFLHQPLPGAPDPPRRCAMGNRTASSITFAVSLNIIIITIIIIICIMTLLFSSSPSISSLMYNVYVDICSALLVMVEGFPKSSTWPWSPLSLWSLLIPRLPLVERWVMVMVMVMVMPNHIIFLKHSLQWLLAIQIIIRNLKFSLCGTHSHHHLKQMLNRAVSVQKHYNFSIFKRTSPPWWLCQGTTLK